MAGHSDGRGGPRSQFLGAASYPWNQGKWQFLWRFKWNCLIENIIQNIFETQCMQLCWAKYGKGLFPFKICFRLVVVPIVKYFASTWPKCVGGWDCNICSSWSIPSGHNPLCQKKQMFKENQKQNINPYQTIVHRGAIESFCISCNQPSSQMTGSRVDRPSFVSSHL